MANTFNLGNGNWAQKTEKLLAYNAENNNYKPLPFDFDRASTATRVNKQGLIETVGVDVPRIDYTGNTKGHLLLEPSRRNLVKSSGDISTQSTYWLSNQVGTSVQNATVAPDGSNTASQINTFGQQYGGITQGSISVSNTEHTYSVYLKAKDGTPNIRLIFFDGVTFHSSDFTITSEWVRYDYKFTPLSGSFQIYITCPYVSTSFYAWGIQLEEGSYATSYIPTQGETNGVTRLVDACYNNNLGNVIGQTEGTFYIETIPLGSTTSFTERIMQFEASGSDFITFQRYANSNLTFYGTDGSNSWTIQGLNLFVGGETIKIAGAYKDNDIVLYVNGVQIGTNNTANAPQVDRMWFANNASGSLAYSGSHKEVKFYNTRLSNSELATLTTL